MKKNEFSEEKFDALIEEATVDCYGDYECLTGFCCTFENEFEFPFKAKIIGEEVKVIGVTENGEQIEAICKRNGKKSNINILNLKIRSRKEKEWIKAYKKWLGYR